MVVNGTAEFVGSRKAEARQHVEAGLKESPAEPLTLSLVTAGSGKPLKVAYAFPKTEEKLVLHCALVEKGLSSEVRAGENAGKKLYHENVVREFQSLNKPVAEGELVITYPAQKGQFDVIAYLAKPRHWQNSGRGQTEFIKTACIKKSFLNPNFMNVIQKSWINAFPDRIRRVPFYPYPEPLPING